jgi:hypothetical protein
MKLSQFLESLFDSGRVVVNRATGEISDDDRTSAREVLASAEQVRRLEVPGESPPWDEASGLWAAEMFFRACQCSVQRDIGAEAMQAMLGVERPAHTAAASEHYSVDLVFRFLPDLYTLAREASREDPLVPTLESWASLWPLSSVGMKDVAVLQIEPLVEDPVLLRYYAERIIAKRDGSRLSDPCVAEAVRAQLGLHKQLAPEMWKMLA